MFPLNDLEHGASELAHTDVAAWFEDDQFDAVISIERIRRMLDAAEGALLAELDATGAPDLVHGLRTTTWLSRDGLISHHTAATRVRVAKKLRTELPATRQALADGLIGFDHATVMAGAINDRIAPEFRQLEPELLTMSTGMVFDRWKQHVNIVAHLLDQDGPEPSDDLANNRLHLRPSPDGAQLNATLVGDRALTIDQAIEHFADQLFRQFANDNNATGGEIEVPSRPTLRALALEEICRRAMSIDTGSSKAPKVEATIVINAAEPDQIYTGSGLKLQSGHYARLLCNACFYPIVVNALGVPLDMGREIRTANREQRRALNIRDGGCVFPGCIAPPDHCDAHHINHWTRDHGTTDVKHLVLLCRHHHGVIHRTGWNILIGDDGHTTITTPRGHTIRGQQHHTQHQGPAPPDGG